MFAKCRTQRAIDALQEYSLLEYSLLYIKLTDTVQFEGKLDNELHPLEI